MTVTANWYHCSVKPISRSTGRSSVAAAAYRLGERLHDERTDITHDYTKRTGVEATFIVAPSNAPEWARDPERLWNAAEAKENRCNSQTAREVELALPSEVGKEGREQIAHDFATHLMERYKAAVMVALHEPSKHGDDRNYHAHIMMTTRRMEAEGLSNKTRELDDKKTGRLEVLHIREYAADLINQSLEKIGSDERIDHRSFKDRGIDKIPTKHLSLEALAMEKRGERSTQGDRNREAIQTNENIQTLLDERQELDRQISEEQTRQTQELELKPVAETNPAPTAKKSDTHWQERIKAEREGEGDNEGGTVAPISAKESPAATSSINNPVTIAHAEQIATHGEIQHKGLVTSWVEHAIEWVHELHEGIAENWEILKEKFKGGRDNNQELADSIKPQESVAEAKSDNIKPELQKPKHFWQWRIGKNTIKQQESGNESKPADYTEPAESKFNAWDRLMGEDKKADDLKSYDRENDPWANLMEEGKTPENKEELQNKGKFRKTIDQDNKLDNDNDIER